MPDAAVIDTGGGGGGGGSPFPFIADHPIIAAAGVGVIVGLVVLVRRASSSPSDTGTSSAAAPSGGQLSPSANIALGQVAYDVTQGFGQASIATAQNQAQTMAGIDSITQLLNALGTQVEGVNYNVSSGRADMANYQSGTEADFTNLYSRILNGPGAATLPTGYYGIYHPGDFAVASGNALAATPAMPALSSAAA